VQIDSTDHLPPPNIDYPVHARVVYRNDTISLALLLTLPLTTRSQVQLAQRLLHSDSLPLLQSLDPDDLLYTTAAPHVTARGLTLLLADANDPTYNTSADEPKVPEIVIYGQGWPEHPRIVKKSILSTLPSPPPPPPPPSVSSDGRPIYFKRQRYEGNATVVTNASSRRLLGLRAVSKFAARSHEGRFFDAVWASVWQAVLEALPARTAPVSILTNGARQSLVGAKMAARLPQSVVVSILPGLAQDARHIAALEVQEHLSLQNQFIAAVDMTPVLVDNLLQLPDLFRFQVWSRNFCFLLIQLIFWLHR
jgi:hypothetical protein